MASIEVDMVAAYRRGRAAARSGQMLDANPFSATAPTAVERVQAMQWVRGYGAGNPVDPEADITTGSREVAGGVGSSQSSG